MEQSIIAETLLTLDSRLCLPPSQEVVTTSETRICQSLKPYLSMCRRTMRAARGNP